MTVLKTCTRCKEEKNIAEFGVHKSRKDGLRSVCKSCNTAQAIEYAVANKERIVKYQKEYKEKNKTRINEQIKSIKESNKDYYDLIKKLWKANNKEKMVVYNQNRKAKIRSQSGNVSTSFVNKMLDLQKNKCVNCNSKLNGKYHLDHIMPISLGGIHGDENLQLLCPACNLKKSNKDPIVWANQNGRLL